MSAAAAVHALLIGAAVAAAAAALLAALALLAVLILFALAALSPLAHARAPRAPTVAFFHPHAAGGGGGERVLWAAIAALDARAAAERRALRVVVFAAAGGAGDAALVAAAAATFGLALPALADAGGDAPGAPGAPGVALRIVRLRTTRLLDAAAWPRLTLLGQSLGSMVCGAEALLRARVSLWVDSTGCAFSLPLARAAGARAAAYVHYPTVSAEMLSRVAARGARFNNGGAIARSAALTAAKVLYYRAFACLYGAAGRAASRGGALANSRWTAAHVEAIWRRAPALVYPPCPTAALRALPLGRRAPLVVSLAQFRPEKDHDLQLSAFAAFAAAAPRAAAGVRLALIGGARGAADEARVAALRARAAALGIADRVDFHVNAPLAQVRALLGAARAGLHTMASEHFGIGVVEMQAAGVVTIAHDSGGPQADIIVPPWRRAPQRAAAPPVGLLAATEAEYAAALAAVFDGSVDVAAVAAAGRAAAARFSAAAFAASFLAALWPLVLAAEGDAYGARTRRAKSPPTPPPVAAAPPPRAASSARRRAPQTAPASATPPVRRRSLAIAIPS